MTRRFALPGLAVMAAVLALTVPLTSLAAEEGELPPDQQPLGQLLFNVRHHVLMGEFDLATTYIKVILGKKDKLDPAVVIGTIEDDPQGILNRPDTGIYAILDQAKRRTDHPEFAKAAADLDAYIQSCIVKLKKDPTAINREIDNLGGDPRKQDRALERLRWMSPWSVPMMINAIMDDSRAALRGRLIQALPEMGRPAVEPLCIALDMPGNVAYKMVFVQALGKIGYPLALPFIQQQAETEKSDQLLLACRQADGAIRRQSPQAATYSGSAGKMFYQLAEGYYTDQPSLRSPVKGDVVPLWDYQPAKGGVVTADVPRAIYGSLMTMRSVVRSLKLDKNQPDAVALWLSADIRKEATGAADPTQSPGTPAANIFAMLAGPDILLRALSRAIHDLDSAVALGAVRALADAGVSRQGIATSGALQLAMMFPDRRVRYEAALAYRPYQPTRLPGTDLAVRTLAEALGQTGDKFAVALLPRGPEASKGLLDQLKAAGYNVQVATKRQGALDAARGEGAPLLDLVVVDFNSAEGGLVGLSALREDYRFHSAPTLVVATVLEPAQEAIKDMPMVRAVSDTATAAEITDRVNNIFADAHMLPLTAEDAKSYAVRSADVLRALALEPATAADAQAAIPALLRALGDSRPEVTVAAGQAMGAIGIDKCQQELAQAGLDAKADPAKRIALLEALGFSAKRFGGKITDDQAAALTKVATTDANLDVRTAAAKAMAALGLTIESLILNPPKAPAAGPAPAAAP